MLGIEEIAAKMNDCGWRGTSDSQSPGELNHQRSLIFLEDLQDATVMNCDVAGPNGKTVPTVHKKMLRQLLQRALRGCCLGSLGYLAGLGCFFLSLVRRKTRATGIIFWVHCRTIHG